MSVILLWQQQGGSAQCLTSYPNGQRNHGYRPPHQLVHVSELNTVPLSSVLHGRLLACNVRDDEVEPVHNAYCVIANCNSTVRFIVKRI